jgi:oxygen-independent coproporphyrinogen-3 oxidase
MVATKQVALLTIDEDAELYEHTLQFLEGNGYRQYEVSNFAKPGYKSRHNCNYWNHANYLGFGPSAHSFWQEGDTRGIARRWWNIANVVGYSDRLANGLTAVAGEEKLTPAELRQEEIFLGLRGEGIDVAGFRKRYGRDLLADHKLRVDALIGEGMAVLDHGMLRLTQRGYLVCDEISASLQV